MRAKERSEIKRAIFELMEDDPAFESAIGRLCRLVGWRYPANEDTRNIEAKTIQELANAPNRPFTARTAKEPTP